MIAEPILQIAVPGPFARLFDYLPPAAADVPAVGSRVQVPFGRGRRVGIVVDHHDQPAVERGRLRRVDTVLGAEPAIPAELLTFARWAADYYHHPLGEVLTTLLPAPLRRAQEPARSEPAYWRITAAGEEALAAGLKGQPARQRLLAAIAGQPEGIDTSRMRLVVERYTPPLRALVAAGLVTEVAPPAEAEPEPITGPALGDEQREATDRIAAAADHFQAFLLQGITGSGKTEVYLDAIECSLRAGRQALIIVPEIGLTPQLLARFSERLGTPIAVLHSGLADGERLAAWRRAGDGRAQVILGTRSAVFVPLARPGLIVVDEEHDPSLKQQDGFRYHARDLAVMRARQLDIPIVLGSATPSLESLNNVDRGNYQRLRLDQRAGGASQPTLELVDVRRRRLQEGLSEPLCEAMETHLAAGEQVLLFINRRGWAPTLICDDCGWVAECHRCDARMTVHRASDHLRCHHCGAERRLPNGCADCGSTALVQLGQGTERVEAALHARFPDYATERIDRDSTRRRGALAAGLERIRSGRARILLGTQMLAKGHDFPGVTLVGILDADGGLFSADFRGPEQLAQTILQVAGRAGRAQKPGRVLIQSRQPEHPLLQALIAEGYESVAAQLLAERREAELPPAARMALIRAESPDAHAPLRALDAVREQVTALAVPGLACQGPAPAPMERLAGRFRAQLIISSARRGPLHTALGELRPWLEQARATRSVRWSIDVDPIEML